MCCAARQHNFTWKNLGFDLNYSFVMDLPETATNLSGAVSVRGAGTRPGASARAALNLAIFFDGSPSSSVSNSGCTIGSCGGFSGGA